MKQPRLAFVGLGWIGALRLEALAAAGAAEIAALCDVVPERLEGTARMYPGAAAFTSYPELLDRVGALRLDGAVLATPNALHAGQAAAALDRGLAVFCQKPLARNGAEVRAVTAAARRANRCLAVDYSYRFTDGAGTLRRLVRSGDLGHVRFVETVFHNAYGPDKAWCYDPEQGGGALLDLGVHQIDLALWVLDHPAVEEVVGQALRPAPGGGRAGAVDDLAVARLRLAGGAVVHLAVSWNAHAGCDCVIRTSIFGGAGGAELRNVDGSFYDFEAVRHRGRRSEHLGRESREWMGRGIISWARRLAGTAAYDPEVETSVVVADVVDGIYGAARVVPAREPAVSRAPGP